ncbi:hypothetical protein IEQ34_003284 [Dendrobium chrysotoxum]|uniref:Glucose-6-phosphate isomerase n=1 Tax=Dendrobium chrysotoxum TaxID=161865 RepID=A0AAV7HGU2_DENCH|nr:hypothetical protein IEQ34_003284 [Dendrobium chrysotoxum]
MKALRPGDGKGWLRNDDYSEDSITVGLMEEYQPRRSPRYNSSTLKLREPTSLSAADRKTAYTRFLKRGGMGPRCDAYNEGVAITQENSLLDNTARIEGWLARFPMFDWVGGRTSVMSAVGLLPAALQGINIREMLVGASLMDMANRTTVVRNNPAALLSLCWYWATDGVGSKDMVVLPYKDSLLLFSRYLQQLVMESLGKEFDLHGNRVNQGITVYGNKGSTDQHAYIQQLREGVHNFFVTFIEVLRDRPPGHDWELEPGVTCGDYLFGMLQGTRSALYANDRESITVTVQEVNPRSVGALIALYERAVGIYASLVNINAYHQPGVEAGKKAAGEVLALQKRVLAVLNEASCKEPAEPLTVDEIADRCHEPEQIEIIYKIIAHMAANDRAIIAEGNCGSPRSIKVFLGECNVDEFFTEVVISNSFLRIIGRCCLHPLRMWKNTVTAHACLFYLLGDLCKSLIIKEKYIYYVFIHDIDGNLHCFIIIECHFCWVLCPEN